MPHPPPTSAPVPLPPPSLAPFLTRWQAAGGAERANYQLFLTELCDLLHVPRPDPTVPENAKNTYVFDHAITVTDPRGNTTPNFIDLYKRNHFVLETKQGIDKHHDWADVEPAFLGAYLDMSSAPPNAANNTLDAFAPHSQEQPSILFETCQIPITI